MAVRGVAWHHPPVDEPRINMTGYGFIVGGSRKHPNISQGWSAWRELADELGWLEAARILRRVAWCQVAGHNWQDTPYRGGEQRKGQTVRARECRRCEQYEYHATYPTAAPIPG